MLAGQGGQHGWQDRYRLTFVSVLDVREFVPAAGQGAIAITMRTGDEDVRAFLAPVLDAATGVALTAERAFLRVLDGSCKTPMAHMRG